PAVAILPAVSAVLRAVARRMMPPASPAADGCGSDGLCREMWPAMRRGRMIETLATDPCRRPKMTVSRRDFLWAGAAAAAGLALPNIAEAMPRIVVRERSAPGSFAGRPVIISAANGYDKDPSGKQGIKIAYDMLSSGADPLDAIVAGVQIVEL